MIDITGKVFGKLVVIEQHEKYFTNTYTEWKWLCMCECGNTSSVRGSKLRNGTTKSCGCLVRERSGRSQVVNLKGRRFGRLLVLRESKERKKSGRVLWECLCDCGQEKIVRSNCLIQGHTKSCGCLRKDLIRERRLRQ